MGNIFLACRDDGPNSPPPTQGLEQGACFRGNNTIQVVSGGALNAFRLRIGAFGLGGATLDVSGDGTLLLDRGMHTNAANRLEHGFCGTGDSYVDDQFSVINMSDNAFFHLGNSSIFGLTASFSAPTTPPSTFWFITAGPWPALLWVQAVGGPRAECGRYGSFGRLCSASGLYLSRTHGWICEFSLSRGKQRDSYSSNSARIASAHTACQYPLNSVTNGKIKCLQ